MFVIYNSNSFDEQKAITVLIITLKIPRCWKFSESIIKINNQFIFRRLKF